MSDKRETSDFYPNVRDGIITPSNAETWVEQFEQHAKAALASEENAAKSAAAASNSATSAALCAQASSAGANAANESAEAAKTAQGKAEAAQAEAQASAEGAEAAQAAAASSATAAETAKADAQSSAAQSASRAAFALAAKTEAQSAATVAKTAQGNAEAAQAAAETAQKCAEAAQEAASQSATAAANSAQAAASSETAAAESASAAKASETAAANSATAAASSATDAEAAKAGADAAKAAAASSATAAAKSAQAAAKSATDLAEAVATAESLDGRIGALEAGTGAYIIQSRDVITNGSPTSADVGKALYFDHFANETTSTLAVTNRTPWAQKVCPAPIVAQNPSLCAVGCFDYTKNKKYIVFMTAIATTPIGYLYALGVDGWAYRKLAFKSKLATSHYTDSSTFASYWCRNICVHDGFVFYTRRHYDIGPYLTVCEVDTGKLITNIDIDPKNTGSPYVNSAIWYNPLSGHICVLCYAFSLPSGETWGAQWTYSGYIRVFSWDSETKTLADIPNGDSPATVINVTDALKEGGVYGVYGNGDAYGPTWAIRDQVFMAIKGPSYTALFHATADDRIEPCYEWDVEYETGEDGITRPVWETQPEEWTDADGNTQTIQNYVRNYSYDAAIVPKMTKGRLLKFMCAADYDGVPSGTWSANPVFTQSLYAFGYSGENTLGAPDNYPSMPVLTDGVIRWTPVSGYKFVRQEAFNGWGHLKSVKTPARDGATGLYLLNDVRKGSARKFSGWLPKSGQYIASTGATPGEMKLETQFGTSALLVALTAAQSGTPLSRMGMVNNAGTDSAAMTPLPITATYNSDWWIASMLPYCPFGFFGNVWMTTYKQTIGGVL